MARSVRVELILDALRAVRGAKDFTKAVDDAGDSLDGTATSATVAGQAIDAAGEEMSEAARAAAALDRQIDELTGSLKQMAIAQALGGDFAKQIRQQEAEVRRLTRTRKLVDDADAQQVGGRIGGIIGVSAAQGLFAGLTASFKAPPPQLYAGAGLLAAAIAPTLGAGIAGAVVGGAAAGGVLGGVTIAARDPRVKEAAAGLGAFIGADLERRAAGFVPVVLEGITDIRAGWLEMGPDLDRVFAASRFVDPLVDGIVSGGQRVIGGLADAISKADPVVDQLSDSFSRIGGAVGNTFSLLANDADEGASAINDLTLATENFIRVTGGIVHGLAVVKGGLDSVDVGIDRARYGLENFAATLSEGKSQLDFTADGFKRGSAEAEAYRRVTLGTASAADVALLAQAELGSALESGSAEAIAAAEAAKKHADAEAKSAAEMKRAEIASEDLKQAQGLLQTAQQGLTATLDSMLTPAALRARTAADSLRTATDKLYGSQIRAMDANVNYEASWDDLSESVKQNKGTLDIHSAAGRNNYNVLKTLLQANNDLYFANIDAGQSEDVARKKHENRTTAIREQARRIGLNKQETENYIRTLGRIQPRKETDVILDGMKTVVDRMFDLYLLQRAAATGKTIEQVRGGLGKSAEAIKGRYAEGGWTGPGPKYQPAGTVHADEFVIRKESRQRIESHSPGLLEHLNRNGTMPGYAAGGTVAPVDTSRRWPHHVNMSGSYVMSKKEALSKVVSAFTGSGNWPSGPSAQRGDSGVWRSVLALIRSTGPMSGSFGNAYRHGDPLWHGSGRAVDWMGYNQDGLASFLANRRPLELIHRTNNRDYAYQRGRNYGSFNNALMEAHRNHIHIAMKNGGVIGEPVFGVGQRSGASYSFAENGRPETILPGIIGRGGVGGGTVIINLPNSIVASQVQAERLLGPILDRLGVVRK